MNIFTKPVKPTIDDKDPVIIGEVKKPNYIFVETREYTQEIALEKGEYTKVSFPQCLDSFSEKDRTQLIQDIMVRSLQQSK